MTGDIFSISLPIISVWEAKFCCVATTSDRIPGRGYDRQSGRMDNRECTGARSINSINNTNNLNNVNGRNVLNASNENGSPKRAEEKDVFENKNPNTTDTSEKLPPEAEKRTEGAGARRLTCRARWKGLLSFSWGSLMISPMRTTSRKRTDMNLRPRNSLTPTSR